jgi:hypothetical protein
MARRKHNKKRPLPLDQAKVARPDWAAFRAAYHGQGAHSDKSKYTRKLKHKERSNGHE